MDQILEYFNQDDHLEFLVNFDFCSGESPTFNCEEWGSLYQEFGEYGNQPTILNGDTDLDNDGMPDNYIWNSFANDTYSAYALIDHQMVIRYLFDMPNYYQFIYNYVPILLDNMNGCMNMAACNFSEAAVYDDGSCQYMEECNSCSEYINQLSCNGDPLCMWMGNHCADNTGSCSQFSAQLECIAESGCFWMGDHCMTGSSCFDPVADNFNPMAAATGLEDNSNCIYSPYLEFGCTYPPANNFNPEARVDDGSCEFSYNDVNADGIVDILDIIIILTSLIEPE